MDVAELGWGLPERIRKLFDLIDTNGISVASLDDTRFTVTE